MLLQNNSLIGDGNTTAPSAISGVISDNNQGYGFTFVGNTAVTLALSNANGATLSGTLTQTASNGVATFIAL